MKNYFDSGLVFDFEKDNVNLLLKNIKFIDFVTKRGYELKLTFDNTPIFTKSLGFVDNVVKLCFCSREGNVTVSNSLNDVEVSEEDISVKRNIFKLLATETLDLTEVFSKSNIENCDALLEEFSKIDDKTSEDSILVKTVLIDEICLNIYSVRVFSSEIVAISDDANEVVSSHLAKYKHIGVDIVKSED